MTESLLQHRLEHFSTDVFLYTDAAGERVFYTLATFALSLLALPFSNASVERCFSQMNIIKCKLRIRMKQPMLEATCMFTGMCRIITSGATNSRCLSVRCQDLINISMATYKRMLFRLFLNHPWDPVHSVYRKVLENYS